MSSALRVLAGAGLSCCEPRKEQLLAGPQKVGYVLVPVKTSRVILRPVFFTFCGVLSRKLNRECVFVFGSKKTKRRWRFSFFIRLSRTRLPDMEPGRESRPGLRIAATDSRLSCSAHDLLRSILSLGNVSYDAVVMAWCVGGR